MISTSRTPNDMPVIRYVLPNPTDLVLQGEQMRFEAMGAPMNNWGNPLLAAVVNITITPNVLAGDGDAYLPMHPDFTPYTVRLMDMPRANNVICGSCGQIVPMEMNRNGRLISGFVQSTSRWFVSGVTRDDAMAILPNCRVVILDVGQMTYNGMPFVAEGMSDGSGNYSIEVPRNTSYQGTAYLDGSPDAAGASINELVLTQV